MCFLYGVTVTAGVCDTGLITVRQQGYEVCVGCSMHVSD